jgi:hypothetical protein
LISYFARDFFVELGKRGAPIHWSLSIETEFREVWARLFPERAANGARIIQLMRRAVPDWRAPESRQVSQISELPDADDRHVLAAAVGVGATVIVTWNLKDFPSPLLNQFGVVARTPDDVLAALFDIDPDGFIAAAATMRARLKNPAMTPAEWLEGVRAARLTSLADRLADASARL